MLRKHLLRPSLLSLLPAVAGHASHSLADVWNGLPRLGLRARLNGFGHWLAAGYRRYRQRRALLALSDAMLKDIGISRADAWHEA
ncbi:MAG TPA: DUF1127 domain-containing protein, partial [Plasticicumulans sp.]|uniref:DUF1127 domain-containing protein n=1 Tax=Plasticicumulans sp. TaxID=2307179 RepID=UPI002B89E291